MKIGILQTGHVSDKMISATGDYGKFSSVSYTTTASSLTHIASLTWTFPQVPMRRKVGSSRAPNTVLMTPCPLSPNSKLWCAKFINAANLWLEFVSSCQIIAQALGGRVEKFSGGWSVGHTSYTLEGQPVSLNAWHQDQVVQCPSEAHILGSSDFCKYAFLGYGDHVFTVQAHPEFNSDFIQGLITYRAKGIVPDPLLNEASEKLALPNNNTQMRERILNLFLSAMVSS